MPPYVDNHESKYDDLLKDLQSKGEVFTDSEFPGDKTSLIPDWNDKNEETTSIVDDWAKVEWHRPNEIKGLDENVKLFEGKVVPNDIKQGALGDCYFLSSLSVMAENPERIKRLFHNDTVNKEGVFAVDITKNGHKQ